MKKLWVTQIWEQNTIQTVAAAAQLECCSSNYATISLCAVMSRLIWGDGWPLAAQNALMYPCMSRQIIQASSARGQACKTSTKRHLCSKFLNLNVFPLLFYTLKHILLLTSLFTFVKAWYSLCPFCRQERNSKTVFGREIMDKNLVYWTSFFILKKINLLWIHFLSFCVQLLFHPSTFHPKRSRVQVHWADATHLPERRCLGSWKRRPLHIGQD